MKKINIYLISISFVLSFSSCTVFQPSRMFRLGKTYEFADSKELPRLNDTILFYKIAVGDNVSFSLLPNRGEIGYLNGNNNINNMALGNANNNGNLGITGGSYLVEYDGTIKLPVFGRTKITGYTLREAEKFLEDLYSQFYVEPIVNLNVTNKRIFMFSEGSASIVNLPNYNTTTLLELLAGNGGVQGSKAYNIKIIRTTGDSTKVYKINLSTMKNFDDGNIVLLANDIIYLTPLDKYMDRFGTAIAPYMSFATFVLSTYSLIKISKL